MDEDRLTVAIKNIARTCGDEISEEGPILDARLEDGLRVAAMFPPCSVGGATLTVRRFSRRYPLDDVVDVGSVPVDAAALLRKAVASRQNVLIFGWNRYRKDDAFERPRRDDLRHRPNPRSARRRQRLCLKSQTMCALKRGRVRAPFDGTAPLPPVTIADRLRATFRHRPIGAACPASVEQATIRPHVVAQATLWCSPMRPRRYSMAHLPEPIAGRAWDASCLMAWFILRSGSDEVQHQADDKNDACGIGRQETRHPRWERCIALWSAL